MKKQLILLVFIALISLSVWSQDNTSYPEPEFSKEVYLLKKQTPATVLRLEKNASKWESKIKMGGMAGSETGYSIEGEKSPIRLNSSSIVSFVYSTGATSASSSHAKNDSMMRANGIDPAMMQSMSSFMEPANTIALYKAETGKGKRKIIMTKTPAALPLASNKMKSSDKYSFSVKKIKEGYWELVIDKPLVKGEYAFSTMSMGIVNADGGTTLFCFGID